MDIEQLKLILEMLGTAGDAAVTFAIFYVIINKLYLLIWAGLILGIYKFAMFNCTNLWEDSIADRKQKQSERQP